MSSVSSIAKHANSCASVTPEMALIDALDDIRNGTIKPTKLLIIHIEEGLGEEGTGFIPGYFASGLRLSEHLVLCEIHKAGVLREMGLSG